MRVRTCACRRMHARKRAYLYECTYACLHECMYACTLSRRQVHTLRTHTCMPCLHVLMHEFNHVCMHARIRTYRYVKYAGMHERMHACMYIRLDAQIHVCRCAGVRVWTFAHMHARTIAPVHICTCASTSPPLSLHHICMFARRRFGLNVIVASLDREVGIPVAFVCPGVHVAYWLFRHVESA